MHGTSPATQQVGGQPKRLTETKTGVSPGHVVQAERSNTSQLKERAIGAGAETMSRKVGLGRKAWFDFVDGQTNKPGAGRGPVNFRDTLGALVDDWQLIPSGGRNMGGREAGRKIITCLPIRPGGPTPLQSMTSPATQWPPALVKAGLSSTVLKGSIFFWGSGSCDLHTCHPSLLCLEGRDPCVVSPY